MKWFFALNETGNDFANYAEMAKVAVYTALQKTKLEPHFIYDGEENALTEWMRGKNVKIFKRRSFLYECLKEIAENRDNHLFLDIGAGAFLRLEVPQIVKEEEYPDNFVLYTDVDVMFEREVCDELSKLNPKYFAVAPEAFQNDYNGINSGVMLMNIENLTKNEAGFRRFVAENLSELVDQSFDQGAYKAFYRQENRFLRKIFGNRWNKLDSAYNWKPYWGKSEQAKIIHFHGPKPYQSENLFSDNVPEHLKTIVKFTGGGYAGYAAEWKLMLKAAG